MTPLIRDWMLRLGAMIALAMGPAAALAENGPERPQGHVIALCVLRPLGKFASRDRPGGVEQSPRTSAIYTIDVDSRRLTKIVDTGGRAEHPRFSPDGQWLYFQTNDRGHWDICRCRPDGSRQENLTAQHKLGLDSYGFELSPQGAVVFAVHDGRIARTAVMEPDGGHPHVVAPELGHCYMATFSPNGQEIVLAHTAGDYRIVWVDLKTGRQRVLTPNLAQCFVPRFTPDGRSVVFIRRDGDLYRADLAGGGVHRLTAGNGHLELRLSPEDQHASTDGPDIAPDGQRIAYVRHRDKMDSIWTIGTAGENARPVSKPHAACGRARWSPDGKSISFVSFVGQNLQLFVLDVATGAERQLTTVDGAVFDTHWLPMQLAKSKGE